MATYDCLVEGRAAMSTSLAGLAGPKRLVIIRLPARANVSHRIDEHGKKGLVSPETRNDQ